MVANAKHYILNNQAAELLQPCGHTHLDVQETNRNAVSEEVDERTRFEMYSLPFRGAIEAGVGSIMCRYLPPRPRLAPNTNLLVPQQLQQDQLSVEL